MVLARLGATLVALVFTAAPASAGPVAERWLALEVGPLAAADASRLVALGWEMKPVERARTRIYVPSSAVAEVEALGLDFVVAHDDLAAFYSARLGGDTASLGPGSMGGYYTFAEAVAELDALVAAHPTLIAAKRSIGKSREGRDLWAWKLSARADLDEDARRGDRTA